MHSSISHDYLTGLLTEFNLINTWTKQKKLLKEEIVREIDALKLEKIVANKSKYQLSKFGQKRIIRVEESSTELRSLVKSQKVELICLGAEHCVYYWIALREV